MSETAQAFDFGTVEAKPAELPKDSRGRKNRYESNPFEAAFADSLRAFRAGENAGRQTVVPAKAAMDAVYLIRRAANDAKAGSRVILRDSKGRTIEPTKAALAKRGPDTQVTVLFSAKNRKQAKSKSTESESTENAPESTESAPRES